MNKNYKKEILRMFSSNLKHFFPDHKDHFMCPTCLKKIPVGKIESISEAHIIPKAAGGKFKTFICRKCNSTFGTKQDKWFGELVRLLQIEKSSIMHTKIKDRYFEIDGIRLNGRWEASKNGNFEFLIYQNLNSPEAIARINEKLNSSPPRINLSFPVPLMKNKHLVDVGFLTAGYLMWFGYLGYSWVLQDHLDPIREQILNPEKEIIKANFVATCNEIHSKPWMGFMPINNDVVLTFGIGPHIVILPPRYNSTLYSSLGAFTTDVKSSDIKVMALPEKPHYGKPVGLMFEDKILIFPDMVNRLLDSLHMIHFTKELNTANILRSVTEEEYLRLSKEPHAIKTSIKL